MRLKADVSKGGLPVVFLLDGVSKANFDRFYDDGLMPNIRAYFKDLPVASVVSTFPALTKPAHSEYLGLDSPIGYEALKFIIGQNRLHNSYPANIIFRDLLGVENPDSISAHYDSHKGTLRHMFTFLDPERMVRGDALRIERSLRGGAHLNSLWFLGTDELTHRRGIEGLVYALREVDAIFADVISSVRPSRVMVFSDHGNHARKRKLVRSDLERTVESQGFRISSALKSDADVVIPSFGLISFAAVYAYQSVVGELADVLVNDGSVDFVAYLFGDSIFVNNRKGRARIDYRSEGSKAKTSQRRFRYRTIDSDVLRYASVFKKLSAAGLLDCEGFVDGNFLFTATKEHHYPDALNRIYNAFFYNKSPANILVSLKNGYYHGRRGLDRVVDVFSTHGNMTAKSSVGFVLLDGAESSHYRIGDLSYFSPVVGRSRSFYGHLVNLLRNGGRV